MKTQYVTKVRYAHPENGYSIDQERAKEHLNLGEVYTTEQIKVSNWHTTYWLKEIPELSFNSDMFEVVE